jgi:hypothetical protein
MPLVIFGDGLKNKSNVKFKGLRHGVTEKIYRQLKLREKLGQLILLDIDEYNTSNVRYIRVYIIQVLITYHFFYRLATAVLKKAWRT